MKEGYVDGGGREGEKMRGDFERGTGEEVRGMVMLLMKEVKKRKVMLRR